MKDGSSRFRRDINGLRAIAVMAVVLFHFAIPGFQGGFVGVDIFFVISGYLITSIIYPKLWDDSFSVIAFYLNRGRRIIPGLAFLCVSLLAFGWYFFLPFEYKLLGKHAAGSIGFVSNILYWMEGGYFDLASQEKWLLHTWSLSVEWQFYILYPLILVFLAKVLPESVRRSVLILAIASFAVSVYLATRAPAQGFFFLHSRAWELLAGAIVYLFPVQISARMHRVLEWIGLSLILFSIGALNEKMAWPGFAALVPVIGTALIIIAGNQQSIITGNSLFQFLGIISYSIYLWHWPVFVALNFFGKTDQAVWTATGICSSVIFGYLSCRFVETPALKWGARADMYRFRSNLPAVSTMTAVIFIVGLFGTEVFARNGIPSRVSESVEVASMEVENTNPLTKQCFRESGPTSPSCVMGKHKNDISVIVLGDSHANAIVTAVANALPDTAKGGALFLGYGLCPTILGIKIKGKDADHQCAKFIGDTFAKLAGERPDLPVVVINRTSFYVWGATPAKPAASSEIERIIDFSQSSNVVDDQYLSEFRTRYIDSMCQLSKNHPVYVTKPIPEFAYDVPRTLAKRLQANASAEDITLSLVDYKHRNEFAAGLMEEAQNKCGVHILDPVPYLCPNGKCMGSLNERPLYFDSNHLSEYGNKFLVPMFRNIFATPPVADTTMSSETKTVGLTSTLSTR